jgi:hypothetical protein
MKNISSLVLLLFLTGCAVVPVKQKFPEVPTKLIAVCPDLNPAKEDTVDITELLKVIVGNYQLYYECQNKNSGWIEWYNNQKKIFEQANK